jgi:hypothetical protein
MHSSNEERRAALIQLRHLLKKAEASLAADSPLDAIEEVTDAFENFRNQYREPPEGSATSGATVAARRSALLKLAAAIGEIDDSSTARDSERMRAALEVARQAADVCQRLDESSHPSGLRVRFPAEPDDAAPAKRSKNR